MKAFVVYTLLRLLLFVAALAVVAGAWMLISDQDVPIVWPVVIALALSGVASYFLLDRQRAALARKVEEKARRASDKLEEIRSKEDVD